MKIKQVRVGKIIEKSKDELIIVAEIEGCYALLDEVSNLIKEKIELSKKDTATGDTKEKERDK